VWCAPKHAWWRGTLPEKSTRTGVQCGHAGAAGNKRNPCTCFCCARTVHVHLAIPCILFHWYELMLPEQVTVKVSKAHCGTSHSAVSRRLSACHIPHTLGVELVNLCRPPGLTPSYPVCMPWTVGHGHQKSSGSCAGRLARCRTAPLAVQQAALPAYWAAVCGARRCCRAESRGSRQGAWAAGRIDTAACGPLHRAPQARLSSPGAAHVLQSRC
jgi:hypothetical protein